MRYNTIFKNNICRTLFLVAVTMLVFTARLSAQQSGESLPLVTIKVADSSGNPVEAAEVVIGEGTIHVVTNKEGIVSFSAPDADAILVRKYGYDRIMTTVGNVKAVDNITLVELPVFTDKEDDISLPFTTGKKRYSLGSSYVIKGEALEKFPSTDIRRALTGLVPGLDVKENHGGPGVTAMERMNRFGSAYKVSMSMRGNTPIYMVDNVPVDINETQLDPQEVESVTVIKDLVEKNMYGPFAANGIIHIKTRRGVANDRYLRVNYEEGVNVVDRFPEFLGGVEYAQLNNIARNNSGLDMLYTKSAVDRYAKNDPYDMLYPNVDFRKMMLRNTMSFRRANVSSGGGNDMMTYFAYLGYVGEDDIYKIGPRSDYDRINFNANLDVRLNSFIKSKFGFFSTLANRRSANYGYNSNYSSESESENWTMDVIEFKRVIGHLTTIPHIAFPVYANNEAGLTRPWYAVSPSFTQNPIANQTANGSYNDRTRKGLINASIDMDFSFLLPGLSTTTYFALDATNLVRLGTAEDYDAYLITKGIDTNGTEVPVLTNSNSHSLREMANKTKLTDYYSQRLYGFHRFNYENTFGRHEVQSGLNMLITKNSMKYISEHRREATMNFSGGYAYDGKYLFQTSLTYSGTYSLRNNRYSFSPTFAAGWILSEENFMKNIKWINYLKLRTQFGVMSYDGSMSANRDIDNYSRATDTPSFGPHTSNQWFGNTVVSGAVTVNPSLIGNPMLRLQKRQEFNIGAEALLFNKSLYLEFNYYNNLHDGNVTDATYIIPMITGITGAGYWVNYNKTRYYGFELAAKYNSSRSKDFSYSIGLNASLQNSRVVRVDEPKYNYPYQSKVGYPAGAIFGHISLGQYATDAEAQSINQLYDEKLHAGDLKYKDMNGDGTIDANDRCYIGNSIPKLIMGINVNLNYKDFDMTITGTCRAFYDLQLTNSYFWNGWGDNNYSAFTRDHQGRNGYPKMTYEKVNNNFVLSDFWLQDGSYFKIKNVEIGWNMPVKKWGLDFVRGIRVYVSGANLLTFSKVKDVDPESIDAGINHYPLFKTFVGGLQFKF